MKYVVTTLHVVATLQVVALLQHVTTFQVGATLQALASLEECRSQEGVGMVLVVRLTQPPEIVSGNPSDVVRLCTEDVGTGGVHLKLFRGF